jgi:hypothetical protein
MVGGWWETCVPQPHGRRVCLKRPRVTTLGERATLYSIGIRFRFLSHRSSGRCRRGTRERSQNLKATTTWSRRCWMKFVNAALRAGGAQSRRNPVWKNAISSSPMWNPVQVGLRLPSLLSRMYLIIFTPPGLDWAILKYPFTNPRYSPKQFPVSFTFGVRLYAGRDGSKKSRSKKGLQTTPSRTPRSRLR